jgi:hypothetical protein
MESFWSDIIDDHTGPPLTDAMVEAAEDVLGYKLPASYLRVLWLRNGGYPKHFCFPTRTPTSWANDHIQISTLYGVGANWGIERSFQIIRERGYPNVGIVIADAPTGCADGVMLDYSECGTDGEPRVVYVEAFGTTVTVLAPNFDAFVNGLVDGSQFAETEAEA